MRPFTDTFAIVREQHGATVALVVTGELDIATVPQLDARYAEEQRDGAELIVVDLAGVTFMDSTGLHTLLTAYQTEPERLRIILSPAAARVIDVTGVRSRLPIIEG